MSQPRSIAPPTGDTPELVVDGPQVEVGEANAHGIGAHWLAIDVNVHGPWAEAGCTMRNGEAVKTDAKAATRCSFRAIDMSILLRLGHEPLSAGERLRSNREPARR